MKLGTGNNSTEYSLCNDSLDAEINSVNPSVQLMFPEALIELQLSS